MSKVKTENAFPRYKIMVNHLVQGTAAVFATIFFKMVFKVVVEGEEYIQKQKYGPYIYASNHVSELDSVLIRTTLPIFNKKSTLFAVCRERKEYDWHGWRKFAYSDWFFRVMGAYPAIKGTHDYGTSLKTLVDIGNSKQTVLIFIGGRQRKEGETIKNKGGTAYLSWTTGLPVVPVAITGTFNLSYWRIFFGRQKIIIRFGKPIQRKELFAGIKDGDKKFSSASSRITKEIHVMIQKNSLVKEDFRMLVKKKKLQPVSNI